MSESPWTFSDPGRGAFHLFESDAGTHLFVADASRIYRVGDDVANMLRTLDGEAEARAALAALGIVWTDAISDEAPRTLPMQSLSLAVSQACNLGCTYCYAEGGSFGGPVRAMPLETALRSVDLLFAGRESGETVQLAFLGGEPLVNRYVLRAATEHACSLSEATGVGVRFGITTNATLLDEGDADFFEKHRFAITVSIDGGRGSHDRQRPFKNGDGSFERIVERIAPLLARGERLDISARATITPASDSPREVVDELAAVGFRAVGLSPMLASPTGAGEMSIEDLRRLLEGMIECGREFERQLARGITYPFTNLPSALREIHHGTHRPYPCGAGAGYFGVSSNGNLFACHRFVDADDARMGSITTGVDLQAQANWLGDRHVHRQEPCRSCWARYLCGGGCHHEIIRRGRVVCEYVRGWLEYSLQAYARLIRTAPEWFGES